MKRLVLPATVFATALLAAACGGGTLAPAQETVQGVAAIGAAIQNATVTVTNADGDTATATTSATGNYTVEIDKAPPYLLKVEHNGQSLFSFAEKGGTAHITPLTTLALLSANENKPLASLFEGWKNAPLNQDAVLTAAKKVNANLQSLMESKQVPFATTNIFNAASFAANGTGLDAVLDAMRLRIDCSATSCTQTIRNPAGETLVTWNNSISTTGITFSWSGSGGGGTVDVNVGSCAAPQPGKYSMVVQTAVAGVTVPDICVDGLAAKPTSQSEFCGGVDNSTLPTGATITGCSYNDPVGTISASVTQAGFSMNYTVKYTFVLQ